MYNYKFNLTSLNCSLTGIFKINDAFDLYRSMFKVSIDLISYKPAAYLLSTANDVITSILQKCFFKNYYETYYFCKKRKEELKKTQLN